MKNFIFAMCGFLMMSLVSLGVQASSFSEPILPKSDVVMVDVGLPMIQNEVVKIVPMDYLVLTAPQPVFVIAESPAIQRLLFLNVRSDTYINRSIVRIIVTLHIVD